MATKIPVRQGPNVWVLLRTDRDGASAGEIPQMAAAAVRWFVRGVGAAGAERGGLHELVSVGPNEWRFGWVRPLRVLSVTHAEPSTLPVGKVIASRMGVPKLVPSVQAQKPWWVVVQFWWRGQDSQIDFPAMSEGFLGRTYKLIGADWLLDRAIIPAASKDPGDQTWDEATGKQVKAAAKDLGKTMNVGLGIGALVLGYLILRQLRL